MKWQHILLIGLIVLCGTTTALAQACFSAKQLDRLIRADAHLPVTEPLALPSPPSRCFLPRWSAADLPVFCRIEHTMAKRSPVALKFRLGSVDYVDWLEGKSRFATFAPQ